MCRENIDYFLIVSDDYHLSEYVCDFFKCREYYSGFDGSAGELLIGRNDANLWVDGRYFLHADECAGGTELVVQKMGEKGVPSIADYLRTHLQKGDTFAFDGRCVSVSRGKTLMDAAAAAEAAVRMDLDLPGMCWENRPELSKEPIWLLPREICAEKTAEKLSALRADMKKENADYFILSALDELAYFLNIRGNDVACTPVALGYAIVYADESKGAGKVYFSKEAISDEVKSYLFLQGFEVRDYGYFYEDLAKLPKGKTVWASKNSVNCKIHELARTGRTLVEKESPLVFRKACKLPLEIEQERFAHLQDGIAVTKLLYYLQREETKKQIAEGKLTELDVAEKLLTFRKAREGFVEESFLPIIATGAHGAIIHYEPTEASKCPILENTFLLMDTGGQYFSGTTDVTRTVAIGNLSYEQKLHYTAALKGNLDLGSAVFRAGTTGVNLDILARQYLWELGLDYRHGTGHGVGFLLGVHEGPQGIRLSEREGKVGTAFSQGMITSNEPGVYLENQYGIRLENMMVCTLKEETETDTFLQFETLTLVPFDRNAILAEELSPKQRKLLNAYHERVRDQIGPYLTKAERQWLETVTLPV